MAEINIFNSAGRDAVVKLRSVAIPLRLRWLDQAGRQVSNARVVKSTLSNDLDALLEQHGDLRAVGAALRDTDPEIDLEIAGRLLQETSRVYISQARKVVHRAQEW